MLDIGGLELLVIVVVALVAIGPKELPGAIRTVMTWTRKTRALAREFQSGMEELSREAGIAEMQKDLEQAAKVDELEDMAKGFQKDLDLDEDTKKILEDPETQKLLSEIESGEFLGSPPETPPPAELELAEATPAPAAQKVTEAPPGATGS
jgi:sec-independent protein translocase protein TatB